MMQEAAIQASSNVIPMPSPLEQSRSMFDMPRCRFTPVGLIIEKGMPIDDWVELGKKLVRAKDSLGIWRGDWIEYGKHEYKKKYAAALEMTGLKEGTLRNDVWVSKAIPLSLRSDKLKRSHYMELAPLKTKTKIKKWIELTIRGDGRKPWSVGRLRKEMNKETAARESVSSTEGTEVIKEPPVLSVAARRFLDDYMGALARLAEKIPMDLPAAEREAIESMVHEHGADALRFKNRTRKSDCDAIVKMLKDTEEASHTGEMAAADLYDWMLKPRYFMAKSDYRDRLEYMSQDTVRIALFTDAGKAGKLEDSRGALPGIVCVPFRKVHKNSKRVCDNCGEAFEPSGKEKSCDDCRDERAT